MFKVSKTTKKATAKKLKQQQKEDKEFKALCKLLEEVVDSWKK